jgi:BirA family transcriptional regulator, biotin operon repressor / biotin---[acetyl-CoA-carboxylase] ligase
MYDLAALDSELAGTIFAGKLHYAAVTGSTNLDAMAAARAGAPHGSVWLADEQTTGRGRGDHRWHSAAGEGLYASVLLRSQIPAERVHLLPLVAGLAAAEAVRNVAAVAIDLRWPNDLLVGARKTGGILVEAQIDSKTLRHAVMGIGINVHQREFPPELNTPATSLDIEVGRRICRQVLLTAVLRLIEAEMTALADADSASEILARVERASSWVRGRSVSVHGSQACEGVTAGLDQNGFLRVQTAAGLVVVQTGGIRAAEPDS